MVDLPKEMIREIQLRLPVKALLRFKCVCKEWCALIGSRSFMDGHYSHGSNPDCLVIERDPIRYAGLRELSIFSYTDVGTEWHLRNDLSTGFLSVHVLGPANGIFCAVNIESDHVALFNPATRKMKPLPSILLRNPGLVFGFGFDPLSADYKVVVFEPASPNFFCVYNSSSDSWRKAEVGEPLDERLEMLEERKRGSGHEVVLNGVYHWLMDDVSILGFDMRSENFHVILPPDAIIRDAEDLNVDMTAYGDSLALLSCHVDIDDGPVDLWVMGRDGLWNKRFCIALPQSNVRPLCVWNKNELLLEPLTETELFMCDISSLKLRKVELELLDNNSVCGVLSYKESLFSFEGETDMPDRFGHIFESESESE